MLRSFRDSLNQPRDGSSQTVVMRSQLAGAWRALVLGVAIFSLGCKPSTPPVIPSAVPAPANYFVTEQPVRGSHAQGDSWGQLKVLLPKSAMDAYQSRPANAPLLKIGRATVVDAAGHRLELGKLYAPVAKQTQISFSIPRGYEWHWDKPLLKLEFDDHHTVTLKLKDLPDGETVVLCTPSVSSRVQCQAIPNLQTAGLYGSGYGKPGPDAPGFLVKFDPPLPKSTREENYAAGLMDTNAASHVGGWLFETAPDAKAAPGSRFAVFPLAESTKLVRIALRHVKCSPVEDFLEFPGCRIVSKFGGTGFQVDADRVRKTRSGWEITLPRQYSGPQRTVKRDSRSIDIRVSTKRTTGPSKLPACLRTNMEFSTENGCGVGLASPATDELGLASIQLGTQQSKNTTGARLVKYGTFTLRLRVTTTLTQELGMETFVVPVKLASR